MLGSIWVSNPNIITLHGEDGQTVAVPLDLLVSDSQMAYSILQMSDGTEKHITITTEGEIIKLYVELLNTGELQMADKKR